MNILWSPEAIKDLQVILSIADYLRPNATRGPSLEYLAFTAGMEAEEFRKILDDLAKRNWVTIEGPDVALTLSIAGLMEEIIKVTEVGEG